MDAVLSIDQIRPFQTIVVTGPQRSGTKIVAEIIAEDLGLPYVRESEYGVHSLGRFLGTLADRGVVHAPAMSAYCHLLPASVAVVFVLRELADIEASQARVPGWNETEAPRELAKYFRTDQPPAVAKYDVWERYQKPAMLADRRPFLEVRYPDDIATHQRFVADRAGWTADQTSPHC